MNAALRPQLITVAATLLAIVGFAGSSAISVLIVGPPTTTAVGLVVASAAFALWWVRFGSPFRLPAFAVPVLAPDLASPRPSRVARKPWHERPYLMLGLSFALAVASNGVSKILFG